MVNWKTILGALLIFGASAEFMSIVRDYRSGELEFWPFGADIGAILAIALGVFLIKKGRRKAKFK